MKFLKDYKGKRVQIHCKNKTEFYKLIPLLNKVYRGWNKDSWDLENGLDGLYIDMCYDCCDGHENCNYAIIPATDFYSLNSSTKKKKSEVINNYEIY